MALIASYSFDEGAGSIVYDRSANSRPLTVTANGAWQASGHTGSALGVINTSQAAASGTVSLPSMTACTVMGWVKMQNFGALSSLLMIDNGAGSQRFRIALGGSQAIHFQITTDSDAAWVFTDDGVISNIPPFGWNHIAARWDGLNMEIYLNGTPAVTGADGTVGATAAGNLVGATRLLIGGDQSIGKCIWDDVRVYNESLNQAAITALMNEAVPNSNIYFSNGVAAEGIYMWNGSALVRTDITIA
jgi:hypothetical protein